MANTQDIINNEVFNYNYGESQTIILNNEFKQRIRKIKKER